MAGPATGSTTLAGSQVVAMVHEPLRGNRMNVHLVRYVVIERLSGTVAPLRYRKCKALAGNQQTLPGYIARACVDKLTASERGSEKQRLIATGVDAHLEGSPGWRRRLLKRRIFRSSSRGRKPPNQMGRNGEGLTRMKKMRLEVKEWTAKNQRKSPRTCVWKLTKNEYAAERRRMGGEG